MLQSVFGRRKKEEDFSGATLFGGDISSTGTLVSKEEDVFGGQGPAVWGRDDRGRLHSAAIPAVGDLGNRVGVVDGGVFGRDPESYPKTAFVKVENSLTVPRVLEYLVGHLRECGALELEGIFRKSGTVGRIRAAKELLDDGMEISDADVRPIDVACVLKDFFKEMPTPILQARSNEFAAAMSMEDSQERLMEMRKAVLLLPKLHQDMVAYLTQFLAEVAARADLNKMTAKNLAVCFEPNLFGVVADIQALSAAERIALGEQRIKLIGATELLIESPEFFR
eukprot:m.142416 g.142416  ORF g.142416 m.142416 type:complete len:281 (-) comp14066_c0_seq1:271-1113(-)